MTSSETVIFDSFRDELLKQTLHSLQWIVTWLH